VERAFNTAIHQFQHNGKSFRANVQNAQLSGAATSYVSSVSGLESHQMRPLISRAVNLKTKQPFPSVALSKVQASGGLSSVITNPILSAPSTFTFTTPGASLPVGIYYGNVYGANPKLVPDYTPAHCSISTGSPMPISKDSTATDRLLFCSKPTVIPRSSRMPMPSLN
jgi:hypothetical protein